MRDEVAAHGDEGRAGGMGLHGVQARLQQRIGGIFAAGMTGRLQGRETLLLVC